MEMLDEMRKELIEDVAELKRTGGLYDEALSMGNRFGGTLDMLSCLCRAHIDWTGTPSSTFGVYSTDESLRWDETSPHPVVKGRPWAALVPPGGGYGGGAG